MSTPASSQRPDAARLLAVQELLQRGAETVPQLLSMLTEPSWSVRREVVQALALLGDSAVGPLCVCLKSQRDDEARIAATVDALVSSTAKSVDAEVMALADSDDPAVQADAAQILGRRRSSVANETLAALTRHADDNVAVHAIEALGRLGGRAAVDALIACVRSESFFRTFPAIDVLGRSGDPRAIEPLTELLANPRYALEAARALGRTGDRRAVAPLSALLASPSDSSVRVACLAMVDLFDRHAQLYGTGSVVQQSLLQLASEAMVRRLAQSVSRADATEQVAICRLLGVLKHDSACPALLALLDASANVAEAAGKALIEIGRASESALFSALMEGDSKRRQALLTVVVSPASADALLACLNDPWPEVRARASEALARVGAVSAVNELFARLHDENQRVVLTSVAAIQSLGSAETEALALSAARTGDQHVRRAALRILAYFGYESALPIFAEAVAGSDPRARDTALQGLSLLESPQARALLLGVAEEKDPAARAAAMRALAQLPGDAAVLSRLTAGLQDSDAWVRYYACQTLGKLKASALEPSIGALLQDEAGQVRVAAIEALSHAGSPASLSVLRSFAEHVDLDLRRAALVGLGLTRDQGSLPVLRAAAQDPDAATRLVALSALSAFPGEEVVALLSTAAHDGEETVRAAARNLLAERPGRRAADALVALLTSADSAAPVLAGLTSSLDGRVAALSAALEQADDDRALLLVSCLARSKAPEAEGALYRGLTSENTAVRKATVGALAALGNQEALSAIEEVANTDPDPEVRRTCLLHLAP